MVGIVPGPMALAVFMSPVRSLQRPVVRNLPVMEFSSGRVWHRHDAPLWNCAPTVVARTVPGNGSGQTNVPPRLTNIIAIAAGSDGRIRALFLKCMLGLGSLATGKSPNPQAGKPALRSVDILVHEFRGLSSPQFKNSVELQPIKFRD